MDLSPSGDMGSDLTLNGPWNPFVAKPITYCGAPQNMVKALHWLS